MRIYLAVLAALAATGAAAQQPAPGELEKRVKEYVELRKAAVSDIPKLKDRAEPEEMLAHKQAQAQAIRRARQGAKQGDVLTPPVEAYLKQVVRGGMSGRSGKPAKEAAKDDNPQREGPVAVPLKVNAAYPDNAPLSTAPPTILRRLPPLPEELEFRFVGRHLILYDVDAGLIVDFVRNAAPRG